MPQLTKDDLQRIKNLDDAKVFLAQYAVNEPVKFLKLDVYDIQKAFRNVSLFSHPDKNPGGEEVFKLLSNANEQLNDRLNFYLSRANVERLARSSSAGAAARAAGWSPPPPPPPPPPPRGAAAGGARPSEGSSPPPPPPPRGAAAGGSRPSSRSSEGSSPPPAGAAAGGGRRSEGSSPPPPPPPPPRGAAAGGARRSEGSSPQPPEEAASAGTSSHTGGPAGAGTTLFNQIIFKNNNFVILTNDKASALEISAKLAAKGIVGLSGKPKYPGPHGSVGHGIILTKDNIDTLLGRGEFSAGNKDGVEAGLIRELGLKKQSMPTPDPRGAAAGGSGPSEGSSPPPPEAAGGSGPSEGSSPPPPEAAGGSGPSEGSSPPPPEAAGGSGPSEGSSPPPPEAAGGSGPSEGSSPPSPEAAGGSRSSSRSSEGSSPAGAAAGGSRPSSRSSEGSSPPPAGAAAGGSRSSSRSSEGSSPAGAAAGGSRPSSRSSEGSSPPPAGAAAGGSRPSSRSSEGSSPPPAGAAAGGSRPSEGSSPPPRSPAEGSPPPPPFPASPAGAGTTSFNKTIFTTNNNFVILTNDRASALEISAKLEAKGIVGLSGSPKYPGPHGPAGHGIILTKDNIDTLLGRGEFSAGNKDGVEVGLMRELGLEKQSRPGPGR